MSLNKLPDGSNSPRFICKAIGNADGEEKTLELTEWWCDGKKVETIEQSAESYFYDAFDKASFEVISIEKIEEAEHV